MIEGNSRCRLAFRPLDEQPLRWSHRTIIRVRDPQTEDRRRERPRPLLGCCRASASCVRSDAALRPARAPTPGRGIDAQQQLVKLLVPTYRGPPRSQSGHPTNEHQQVCILRQTLAVHRWPALLRPPSSRRSAVDNFRRLNRFAAFIPCCSSELDSRHKPSDQIHSAKALAYAQTRSSSEWIEITKQPPFYHWLDAREKLWKPSRLPLTLIEAATLCVIPCPAR